MTEKLDMTTPDMVTQNIERIAALFPNCVTEVSAVSGSATPSGAPTTTRKIDFDLLRQELSRDIVEGPKERYRLEWPGKREAIVTANMPTNNTLRPVREDSVNFDTTENLYIEGDNLEVLKLLQESYLGKVKMIYIDPPYNTGNDFVYRDNFAQNTDEFKADSGMTDELGNRLVANPETAGRYHSDWLTMMYPRLKLARNLLTDDGVIFISIDDHEIGNLLKIGDEIFGQNNLIGPIIQNKLNSKNDTVNVQRNHEYIVIYRKREEYITGTKIKPSIINKAWVEKSIINEGNRFYYINDSITTRGEGGVLNKRHNLGYTVYYNPETHDFKPDEDYDKELAKSSNDLDVVYFGNNELISKGYVAIRPPEVRGKLGCWTWSIDKFRQEIDSLVVTGKSDSYTIKKRTFVNSNDITQIGNKLLYRYFSEGNSRSIIDFSTNDGTTVLNELMDFQGSFDNPKNVDMLEYLIKTIPNDGFIVLDFFSGSCSTAHAVMQLNAEDGGNRKFIMVQLPEKTDEKSEAYKAGYHNICEIGKERIRRAGAKIVETSHAASKKAEEKGASLFDGVSDGVTPSHPVTKGVDVGFRVYRLDTSNMQDVYYRPQDYKQEMMDELFANHIKPDRTPDDLVAQVMLDWGLPLSLPIEKTEIAGKTVYKVDGNALYCCFAEGIDEGFVKAMTSPPTPLLEERGEVSGGATLSGTPTTALPLRIVFHDHSFASDTAKENVRQLLKQLSADTEMKVV